MRAFDHMQKFFIKVFSFIIGLAVILNISGAFAARIAPLDDWRIEHQDRLENFWAERNHMEAITLGNSHSGAINYSVLRIEGQFLALAGADLFEVESTASALDNELPMLKTVFIAISYYSFSRDNATIEPFRTRRIGFYSVVPTWSPVQGDLPIFVLGKLDAATHILSVVRSDSWKGVWVGMANGAPAPDPFLYDGVRTNSVWGDCFHYTEEQLEANSQVVARLNVLSSRKMASAHPGLVRDASAALARTIEQFQSKGIRVILFTPPYHQTYNVLFTEQGSDLLEDMKQSIDTLRQIYHVEYYDFSQDSEIVVQPEFFHNSDHLSECGTRVFTEKMLDVMSVNGSFDK